MQHRLLREILLATQVTADIEISSMADIPAGTGLGSSGAFTVGVLKALLAHQHELASNAQLAELACSIEIDRLGEPIGKQDQYIAAFGGITAFEFHPDDAVEVTSLELVAVRPATRSRTTCCSSTPASAARRPTCSRSSRPPTSAAVASTRTSTR